MWFFLLRKLFELVLVKIPKCGHSNESYSEEDFPVVRFIGLSRWFYLSSLGTKL